MKRASWLLLVACLVPGPLRAATDPFVGKWKLDTARTRLSDQMKVASAGPNKYGFLFAGDSVETVVADGTDQPGLLGSTLAVTVQDARNWKVVRKSNGRTTIMALWQLSPDGKTLTDSFTSYGSDSASTNVHYVYERTAGSASSGFVGTWESNQVGITSSIEIEIRPFGDGGLSFINSAAQVTQSLQFDGKEYPGSGPNVPPGFTSSGHRLHDHALERIDKLSGKILYSRKIEVSSDGKVLTMTIHKPGHDEPDVMVFDRE
jgi:hypothetical protein